VPDIFISYRREDAVAHAGRLYDRLAPHFGKEHVFRDIDTIKPGEDFVEALEKTIEACDVFIAVIGRQWLSATDEDGRRRIDLSEDVLRREVEIALDRNIRVIPLLVQGARMPKADELPQAISAFARRHAFYLPDEGFHRAVDELIAAIESVSPPAKSVAAEKAQAEARGKPGTPHPHTPGLRLPDSRIRRLLLWYRPPKVYGWLLRVCFVYFGLYVPVLLVISAGMFLGTIGVSEDLDAGSALGIAVVMGLLALGLRSLTVRLERKFLA
jgi:TIR domain